MKKIRKMKKKWKIIKNDEKNDKKNKKMIKMMKKMMKKWWKKMMEIFCNLNQFFRNSYYSNVLKLHV